MFALRLSAMTVRACRSAGAETLELLRKNSAAAAKAIRELSDEDLDQAVAVSLYSDATVTCQFVLEDHAVRHSYHHLARLRSALPAKMTA